MKLSTAPINLIQTLIDTVSAQLPKSEPELALFRRTLEAPCRILELSMRNCGFLAGTVRCRAVQFSRTVVSYSV